MSDDLNLEFVYYILLSRKAFEAGRSVWWRGGFLRIFTVAFDGLF